MFKLMGEKESQFYAQNCLSGPLIFRLMLGVTENGTVTAMKKEGSIKR